MDAIFEYQIKAAIERLKENNFQEFLVELLLKKHGKGFTAVKQKRDQGCDGIIGGKTVVAAYAPPNAGLNEFKKKAKDDHDKYTKNWSAKYPAWCFVYNGELTAEMVKCIDDLKIDADKWDIRQIMEIVHSLSWSRKRDLAAYLGIDEKYFINDVLRNVIDDMLRTAGENTETKPQEKPIYIEEKIGLNFAKSDVDGALREYEEILPFLTELKDVLKAYSDAEVGALKNKIATEFNKLSGGFKTKLNNLTDGLSERNKNDDLYWFYVRVVVIYIFEICLIGQKVKGEL
jgi:hypothetical protein